MINHLSYSSISKYLKCGKQWKYKYLDKLPEEKSEALEFGSAWHEMIHFRLQENKPLEDCWMMAHEKIVLSEESFFLGTKMLTSEKITKTIQGLQVNPEYSELETELHVPGVPVPIVGFIDAIGLDGVAIDFKTASKKWPVTIDEKTGKQKSEKADKDLQATFYIASLAQMGMIELPAEFYYIVFTKTKRPDVQVLETTRTHKDVFALYSLVNEVWQAIRREVFTPTDPSNWWCSHKYCSFWDVCEYGGK